MAIEARMWRELGLTESYVPAADPAVQTDIVPA